MVQYGRHEATLTLTPGCTLLCFAPKLQVPELCGPNAAAGAVRGVRPRLDVRQRAATAHANTRRRVVRGMWPCLQEPQRITAAFAGAPAAERSVPHLW